MNSSLYESFQSLMFLLISRPGEGAGTRELRDFLSLMFKWDGFLWNEYNLASLCWQCWHHFPPSWSVRLWIQIKQNCRNWQKLWHVTLWQWWDDHCEIIAFLATFGSEFISWNHHQNISRFHSSSACYNWWQLLRRAQYDNPSSFLPQLAQADCCLSVCGFFSAHGLVTESYNWHWLQQPPPAYPDLCPYITILIRPVHTHITPIPPP